uniref:Uncharacterized protein n=1 Tax=Strombidium rassoulzadegani TaxID=1082188 RepID=A0A7S3CMZ7_9SPIT|mmetsp:Transcript_17704/g.29942  ORF Transcript_17704/g.29942 Transcript_17704/m.29942 type:complete len:168 (+) Transcript_17704:1145-1648(+)
MRVAIASPTQLEDIKVEAFDTNNQQQQRAASLSMAQVLQSEQGYNIVDEQVGKESIIQNFNSDQAKTSSQVVSGYSIRHNIVQKMAPGDQSFHLVSWDAKKNFNNMKTFPKREEGDKAFAAIGSIPKILISGETGDVMLSNGSWSEVDQCLGMFFTQRYQGKYFGQP